MDNTNNLDNIRNKYYELNVTLTPLSDMRFNETGEKIGEMLNFLMLKDTELMIRHARPGFKFYSYGLPYPVESDKIYKAGKAYVVKVRSLDKEFLIKIQSLISGEKTGAFAIIACQLKTLYQEHITNLYTVTPAILTLERNCYWNSKNGVGLLQSRLQNNLKKKYESYFQENIDCNNFIQGFEIMNQKPILTRYKGKSMPGVKMKIAVGDDKMSQKLAMVAMACGLGEKNSSLGMGFCLGGCLA